MQCLGRRVVSVVPIWLCKYWCWLVRLRVLWNAVPCAYYAWIPTFSISNKCKIPRLPTNVSRSWDHVHLIPELGRRTYSGIVVSVASNGILAKQTSHGPFVTIVYHTVILSCFSVAWSVVQKQAVLGSWHLSVTSHYNVDESVKNLNLRYTKRMGVFVASFCCRAE